MYGVCSLYPSFYDGASALSRRYLHIYQSKSTSSHQNHPRIIESTSERFWTPRGPPGDLRGVPDDPQSTLRGPTEDQQRTNRGPTSDQQATNREPTEDQQKAIGRHHGHQLESYITIIYRIVKLPIARPWRPVCYRKVVCHTL